jgi:hypothetical protein
MVAYSFQKRFVAPILAGRKRHTIRAARKRHAKVGEAVQLYVGMRTRTCRKIGDALCTERLAIELDFSRREVALEGRSALITEPPALDDFARSDGFADFAEMTAFWSGCTFFGGVLIAWNCVSPAAEIGALATEEEAFFHE